MPCSSAARYDAAMTPSQRWSLVAGAEALLIVLLLPLGGVFTYSPAFHVFQMLALAVVGGAGWVAVLWRPTRLPRALVLAPIPMLAALVVTAIASPYPSLSWPATWVTAAFAGVFWLFAFQASHEAGRRNLLAVIAIVVILAIGGYLLSVAGAWREWLTLGLPLRSLPLRPANSGGLALISTWFADLIALGAPVVVANLWTRGAKIAAVALGVVALFTIVLTGTRSTLLIIVAVSIVAVVMAIRGRATRGIVNGALAGLIVIGITGGVVVLASSRSLDEGRSSAYASAITRLTDSPLTGTGPGTYGVERMSDPVDSVGYLAFPDAHNIFLTTLAEFGCRRAARAPRDRGAHRMGHPRDVAGIEKRSSRDHRSVVRCGHVRGPWNGRRRVRRRRHHRSCAGCRVDRGNADSSSVRRCRRNVTVSSGARRGIAGRRARRHGFGRPDGRRAICRVKCGRCARDRYLAGDRTR